MDMDKGKRALQTATQKICDNYSITQFLQDNLSLVFPFWLNYEPSCQKVGTQIYAHLWQGAPPLDLAITMLHDHILDHIRCVGYARKGLLGVHVGGVRVLSVF